MKTTSISIINNKVIIPSELNEIWMTTSQIVKLFECFTSKVNGNIRAILKSRVLDDTKVCRTYYYKNGNSVDIYNLEMIIALSFRIKTHNTGIFREWMLKRTVIEMDMKAIPIAETSISLN